MGRRLGAFKATPRAGPALAQGSGPGGLNQVAQLAVVARLVQQRRRLGVAASQHPADEEAVVALVLVRHGGAFKDSGATGQHRCTVFAQRPVGAGKSVHLAGRKAARQVHLDAFTRARSTSGGSSDSELKELTVSPTKPPSASQQLTMVTPVVKRPSAWRSCRLSGAGPLVAGRVTRCQPVCPNAPGRRRRPHGRPPSARRWAWFPFSRTAPGS